MGEVWSLLSLQEKPPFHKLAITVKSCRIQVKSRYATDFDGGFPIKNFDCDFVVLVALNRGYRYHKQLGKSVGRKVPQLYVFPVEVVKSAQSPNSHWGKVFLRNIDQPEQYLDNWKQVKSFLEFEDKL